MQANLLSWDLLIEDRDPDMVFGSKSIAMTLID